MSQCKIDLDAHLEPLRTPPDDPDLEYYAVTLTGDGQGRTSRSFCSRWVGWHDLKRGIEMRQASTVGARYAEGLAEIGISSIFVLNDETMLLFLMIGGVGLVEKSLCEEYFPDVKEPFPAYPTGRGGYVDENVLEPGAHHRAPNAKKRMKILNRDNRRCRICGRKPDDYVDLEINVHHIRPWAKGGSTETSNLITLCDTCHDGLDPHFDPSLFDLVEQQDGLSLLNSLDEGVACYRRVIAEDWDRLSDDSAEGR